MTDDERKQQLAKCLDLLQTSGYIYDLSKTGINGKTVMPPPKGTAMSCGSAARIFMQLAADMGIDNLVAKYYTTPKSHKGGYFVLDRGSDKALGNAPQVSGQSFKGWEFENHYRVFDRKTNITYDPTFGTMTPGLKENPPGILATKEDTDPKTMTMISVYGGRYKVERKGIQVTTTELNKTAVQKSHLVTNADFITKAMDNLRPAE